jgi:hypothetical protein
MKRTLGVGAGTTGAADHWTAVPVRLSDDDIIDAYHYMLGRWLVMRQETLDFREGFRWNELVHRTPGGVSWPNPHLDVAYSEAWVAVDETSCTILEIPEISGRYYTVQVLNGWAEVIANINERNFPRHPSGTFALCLMGTIMELPPGAQRINLPNRKARLLIRIELGAAPEQAIALQKRITMHATGTPKIESPVIPFDFANNHLPGVDAFDRTHAILTSDPDINEGMAVPRSKARALARAAANRAERKRIDDVIRQQAIPILLKQVQRPGPVRNGWVHPRAFGNFGSDFLERAVVNYAGIWANNSKEAVYFGAIGLDGSQTYSQTFPSSALPSSRARYFWSVLAVDTEEYKVIPNSLNRHILNKQSPLTYNADGSLTLVYGPTLPEGVPENNWLPTPKDGKYNLTFRFYGPTEEVTEGLYYPPALVSVK